MFTFVFLGVYSDHPFALKRPSSPSPRTYFINPSQEEPDLRKFRNQFLSFSGEMGWKDEGARTCTLFSLVEIYFRGDAISIKTKDINYF